MEEKHYIQAGGILVGAYSTYSSGGSPGMHYYHRDRLGSIAAVSASNALVEGYNYETFGERRNLDGARQDRTSPIYGGATSAATDRGFTEHEHLDEMNLIHMNGRVYDPVLGRFMTPDPQVQAPLNLQSYNRYTYGFNHPLGGVDPSGFDFWPLDDLFGVLDDLLEAAPSVVVGGTLAWALGPETFQWTLANVAQAAAAGFVGGYVASDGNMRSAGIAALSSVAFYAAGGTFKGAENLDKLVAAHAAIGCVSSVMNRGDCPSGALAAGFAKYATVSWLEGLGKFEKGIAVAAIGGTASIIGGGKFANGAMTAAYGYLFNSLPHLHNAIHEQQMIAAGADPARARAMAQLATKVDNLNDDGTYEPLAPLSDSQAPRNAHKHGMCTAGMGMAACMIKVSDYIRESYAMKSMQGLANILHYDLDVRMAGHRLQEWAGIRSMTFSHFRGDFYPTETAAEILRSGAAIIRHYNESCGGCILGQ